MKIVVNLEKCSGSGQCVKACPKKALSLVEGKAQLDEDICDLDGICIAVCPTNAISYVEK